MSAVEVSRPLQLGLSISVRLEHVGAERQPLMIVDDVLADPQAMIDAACEATFYVPHHTNYPGVNAPVPQSYYLTVITALRARSIPSTLSMFTPCRWSSCICWPCFRRPTTRARRSERSSIE